MRTVLKPEWIIDGTGADPVKNHAVVTSGQFIEAVVPVADVEQFSDDTVVELQGRTLIPGLANNHVHLVLPGDNTPFTPWIDLQSDATLALRAAHNLQTSLHAGITTVRDCGGRRSVVLDVRDAQTNGFISGSRILACGWTLTITGGHTRQFGGEADGAENLRTMVRDAVAQGADYIKVMASGGGTPGSLPQYPSFSVSELRAIVETSHSLGRLVAAHCIASKSIENAVAAGVDLIEHASFFGPNLIPDFDPAIAEKLAKSGIPVTPTLQVNRDLVDLLSDGEERELWQQRQRTQRDIVQRLHALGVPLLAGSDAGWRATAFDTFWKELDELVECGLTPVQAIHSATGAVSQALGANHLYGTIEAGQIADLVALDGDVASNIQHVSQVKAVYQSGTLI